jgi:hypothetical protein
MFINVLEECADTIIQGKKKTLFYPEGKGSTLF